MTCRGANPRDCDAERLHLLLNDYSWAITQMADWIVATQGQDALTYSTRIPSARKLLMLTPKPCSADSQMVLRERAIHRYKTECVGALKSAAAKVICSRCNGMGATWHMCSQPDCGEFHKEDCPDCTPLRELGVKPTIHGDT